MGEVREVEIQARLRDINTGGHVDNIEAMRVLDEARIRFFGLGAMAAQAGIEMEPGVLDAAPAHVTNLVGGQRVDHLARCASRRTNPSVCGCGSVMSGAPSPSSPSSTSPPRAKGVARPSSRSPRSSSGTP